MGSPSFIDEVKKLFEDFDEKHAKLFKKVEQQEEEIKKYGETRPATAKSIDELVEGMGQIKADLEGVRGTATDVQSRLDEAEKKGKRPGFGGGAAESKTAAQIFFEDAQVKSLNGLNNTGEIVVGESWYSMREAARKSVLMTSVAPDFVPPQMLPNLYPVRRTLRVRDLFANVPIDVNAFEYFEMTGYAASGSPDGVVTHGAAAMVSEGQSYPEAQMTFTLRKGSVEKVGHYLPVTDEMLSDRPGMESTINFQLGFGVDYRIDHQILYGNGSSPQLPGILTNPGRRQHSWSAGSSPEDTQLDAIRWAIALSHQAEYEPDFAVLNPLDWARIELLKGSDKHYIILTVSTGTEKRLWMIRPVITNSILETQACVGASMAVRIRDRRRAMLQITNSHGDLFLKDQYVIKATERLGLENTRPDAIVDLTLDGPPAGTP